MSQSTGTDTSRFAGQRVHRVEDARLLTGRGTYVDDIQLPGMLHAAFVRSPYPRARILGVDAAEALALPGVRGVFTAQDLNPGVHEVWYTMLGPIPDDSPRPPLAEGEVRFVGDPVAMVVADSRYLAEDAAELVLADYEPLPAVLGFPDVAGSEGQVHEAFAANVIGERTGGDAEAVEAVFRGAAHVVTETLDQQAQAACPMETRGIVADYQRASGELTLYSATQNPHEVRAFGARLLGIPEHRVRVVMRDTGGGFGQKVMVTREEMCLMLAALQLPAPVKWFEDRRENLLAAGQSRHEHATVGMAFDADGAMQATRIDFVEDCGAYPIPYPADVATTIGNLFPGPYRIPVAAYTTRSVCTNTTGRTAYRAPWVFEPFAREVLIDKAARQLGLDPIELRRRNLLRADEMPYTNANGASVYDKITPLECFERALDKLGFEAFRREQAEARKQGRYLGLGTGSYVEPTTPGAGMYGTEGATIRIEPSGKINVYVAGGSAGNSIETTVVQLTADALGADIGDVNAIQGDTAITPFGGGTGGSRSGSMTAGAVANAASALRPRLVGIAAQRLEAAPEDIELVDSQARVRGSVASGLSFAEIAQIAYFQPEELPPDLPVGLEASSRFKAATRTIWANATHACTCEVDLQTGHVELLRYIVSEDCGAMINPNIVEGQIAGGTVQGIAGVLFEHLATDSDGNPLTTTFMDYVVPTAAEIPVIEYVHHDSPSVGPGGYKGVGEGGVLGAVPAVANAVADALAPLGVSVNRLPLSPANLLELIEAARRS